jgi:hypothetical protein
MLFAAWETYQKFKNLNRNSHNQVEKYIRSFWARHITYKRFSS